MAKIIGIKLQAETQKQIEKFENEVLIRHANQQLVGTVYVDLQEHRWSVAIAYNYSHRPGLHGHENPLEVRYLFPAREQKDVNLFRSDRDSEQLLESEPFPDGDAFVRFALAQERALTAGTV